MISSYESSNLHTLPLVGSVVPVALLGLGVYFVVAINIQTTLRAVC